MKKENKEEKNKKGIRYSHFITGLLLWIIVFALLSFLWSKKDFHPIIFIPYSQFYKEVENKNVSSITISKRKIIGEFNTPIKVKNKEYKKFKTYMPFDDPEFVSKIIEKEVEINTKPVGELWDRIWPFLPLLFLLIFWFVLFRNLGNVPRQATAFTQSKEKKYSGEEKVTFKDVAGVDEAKEELREVIEFLKNPEKFERLGAKVPKGILLLGAPGTGKTLLAKATAGEAGVPFSSISGSDFVELFVGVGASRVRNLFEKAKKNRPCIIFIDELDAVGRYRGAGIGGGHDEREQTLNALLVEMDGFESNKGIVVMAATNRPDILDPALLRPGRFDRRIVVDRPDVKGRKEIFKVHTRKMPLGKDVDFDVLARSTPGFSGADIANTVNEAALIAAKKDKKFVEMKDFEEARDKVIMGMERKTLVISETEKKNIAYHEAGHVIVSKFIPEADPVHKVTIIPRGMALGVTQRLPIDDRKTYSKEYCFAQLCVLCGGRASEKIVLNTMTTGAQNDIEQVTRLAKKMICEWGMSDKLGFLSFGGPKEHIFLGREISQIRDFSEETARLIDEEIKKLVKKAEDRASQIIKNNIDKLHKLAKALLEKEVLTDKEINEIIAEKPKEIKVEVDKSYSSKIDENKSKN